MCLAKAYSEQGSNILYDGDGRFARYFISKLIISPGFRRVFLIATAARAVERDLSGRFKVATGENVGNARATLLARAEAP